MTTETTVIGLNEYREAKEVKHQELAYDQYLQKLANNELITEAKYHIKAIKTCSKDSECINRCVQKGGSIFNELLSRVEYIGQPDILDDLREDIQKSLTLLKETH